MIAAKTDGNQAEIVEGLRAIGCSVKPAHMVGKGFPDLVVGFRGLSFLIEIKDPSKPPSKRKLTPDQVKFHAEWRGQICVVETVEEAIHIVTRT